MLLNSLCFVLSDGFLFVHIPLFHMVKFQFFALFLVDHLSHSIMPNLVLFLCKCSIIPFHVINHFVSITTLPTLTIWLCIIDFCFNAIVPYGAVLCNHYLKFNFSFKVSFFSHFQVFSCEMSSVCSLKYPYNYFPSCCVLDGERL